MSARSFWWRSLDGLGLVGVLLGAAYLLSLVVASLGEAEAATEEKVEALAERWADLEECRAEPRCVLSQSQWQELQALRERIREGE